jgi:hypothetical protein
MVGIAILVGIISFILTACAFSPLILEGSNAIADERMELIGHLREQLADSNEREKLLGDELKKYTEIAKAYNASIDAERKLECAMMVAVGEDGIISVSDAIARLKDSRRELYEALKELLDSQSGTACQVLEAKYKAREAIAKSEGRPA